LIKIYRYFNTLLKYR